MLAKAPHCLCPHGQRLVVLREMEKVSIIVELHSGQDWVLLSLASQSQGVSFKHGFGQTWRNSWIVRHKNRVTLELQVPSAHFLTLSTSLGSPPR